MKPLFLLILILCGCGQKPFDPASKYANVSAPKPGEKWWFYAGNPYTNTIIQISNNVVLAVSEDGWTNSMPVINYKVAFHKVTLANTPIYTNTLTVTNDYPSWPWIVSNAWVIGFQKGSQATIAPYSRFLKWSNENFGTNTEAKLEMAIRYLKEIDEQMTNNPFGKLK